MLSNIWPNHIEAIIISYLDRNIIIAYQNKHPHLLRQINVYSSDVKFINSINFNFVETLTSRGEFLHENIILQFNNLTCLQLGGKKDSISDEMFKYLPKLTKLCLGGNVSITDNAFKYLKNLLCLSANRTITNIALMHTPKLHSLNLVWNKHITETAFKFLPNLTSLNSGYYASTLTLTSAIFKYIPKLKKLHIGNIKCDHNDFYHLSSLDTLNIEYNRNITNDAFKYIPNLTELFFGFDNDNTMMTSQIFTLLPKLETLSLGSNINICIDDFKYLFNLKSLDIGNNTCITNDWLMNIPNLSNIKILKLGKSRITDGIFTHMPHLETLDLGHNEQIKNESFAHLSNITSLYSAYNRNIDDEIFKYLPKLIHLDLITGEYINFTPQVVRNLNLNITRSQF